MYLSGIYWLISRTSWHIFLLWLYINA